MAAFAPVHGDVLGSPRAVSVVGVAFGVVFEVEVEAGVAAAVPHSVAEVVLEWIPSTEHGAIVAGIEREAVAGVGLGAVAGPAVVLRIEFE